MEIKSYKKQKKNLYQVYLDNGETIYLYDDVILKYELLMNKKIDKKLYDLILTENKLYEAYYQALKYIDIKMRTELEVKNYLSKKNYDEREIKWSIAKLKTEGFLDNKKYIKAYINDSLNLSFIGPLKIKKNLEKLGIDNNLIQEELSIIPNEKWLDKIEKIIDKKAKVNKNSETVFKNKVKNNLYMLGYPLELIKEILKNYKIDTKEAFLKEADKIYYKLSLNYSNRELNLKFKSKMLSKGYTLEEINLYLDNK